MFGHNRMSVFRSVFGNGWMNGWWKCEGRTRPRRSQALIPKLIYLPRVKTQTQFKSESLKPTENTIKEKPMKVAHNMLIVRQPTHEVGMKFGIKGF